MHIYMHTCVHAHIPRLYVSRSSSFERLIPRRSWKTLSITPTDTLPRVMKVKPAWNSTSAACRGRARVRVRVRVRVLGL